MIWNDEEDFLGLTLGQRRAGFEEAKGMSEGGRE
jgi:hypothetical protein